MKNTPEHLVKIAEFPIGTPFSWKNILTNKIEYGWVTGLDDDRYGEVLFTVKKANNPLEESSIHPSNIQKITYDWSAEQ